MKKMKCYNCKFKHDIGNTDTSGKAICEFPRSFQPIDVSDECHFQRLVIELKDFHYVMNGDLPEDFEVCLIVEKDGGLSAGCWDTGINSQSDGQLGAFRLSRGGSISLDSVWAWLPIEQYRVNW